MKAEEFNAAYPVGTKVTYYPLRGENDELVKNDPDHPPLSTKTRTEAWTLGHGAVVVSVEGKSGGVSIEHLTFD